MIDSNKLEGFVHKALGDIGSALTASLVVIGDKLGLYKAMAGAGPMTSEELAKRTGTNERSVREWLAAQAAAGYIDYDASTKKYSLCEEHAVALTDEESPACVLGGFQGMTAAMRAAPKVTDAFRSGKGLGWHEHDPELFVGVERFFRPGYNANLVASWIPALEGVEATLKKVGPPKSFFSFGTPAGWPSAENIDDFRKQIDMRSPGGAEFGQTEVFYLSVVDHSRDRAAALVAALNNELELRLQSLRDERAQSMMAELQKTVGMAETDLNVHTAKLAKFEAAMREAIARGARRQVRLVVVPLRRKVAEAQGAMTSLGRSATAWERLIEAAPPVIPVSAEEARLARLSPR